MEAPRQEPLPGTDPAHGLHRLERLPATSSAAFGGNPWRASCHCGATWYRHTQHQALAALNAHLNVEANRKIGNRR